MKKGKFYLKHDELGVLYTNSQKVAKYAVKEAGYKRISTQEYGKLKKKFNAKKAALK